MYPLTETCDCCHVSVTVLRVYVKIPFTDSSNFVLCNLKILDILAFQKVEFDRPGERSPE